MKIQQLEQLDILETICNPDPEADVVTGYTSDLLSDVLGNAEDDSVLITIQAHKNSVAVSSIAGCTGIIVCNSRPIPDDMIEAAKENDIAIFLSEKNQYEVSIALGKFLEQ